MSALTVCCVQVAVFSASVSCSSPWVWRSLQRSSHTQQTWVQPSVPSVAAWPPGLCTNREHRASCDKHGYTTVTTATYSHMCLLWVEWLDSVILEMLHSLYPVHEQEQNVRKAPHHTTTLSVTCILAKLMKKHKTSDACVVKIKYHLPVMHICIECLMVLTI